MTIPRGGRGPRVNPTKMRALRYEAGMSQHDLAAAAGVDISTINRLENGRRQRPHPRITRAIAEAVGAKFADITLLDEVPA